MEGREGIGVGRGKGYILLNNIRMAHFKGCDRNFIHGATLQNDLFFKLRRFLVVLLVFG